MADAKLVLNCSIYSSLCAKPLKLGMSIMPGLMALTRIFHSFNSRRPSACERKIKTNVRRNCYLLLNYSIFISLMMFNIINEIAVISCISWDYFTTWYNKFIPLSSITIIMLFFSAATCPISLLSNDITIFFKYNICFVEEIIIGSCNCWLWWFLLRGIQLELLRKSSTRKALLKKEAQLKL